MSQRRRPTETLHWQTALSQDHVPRFGQVLRHGDVARGSSVSPGRPLRAPMPCVMDLFDAARAFSHSFTEVWLGTALGRPPRQPSVGDGDDLGEPRQHDGRQSDDGSGSRGCDRGSRSTPPANRPREGPSPIEPSMRGPRAGTPSPTLPGRQRDRADLLSIPAPRPDGRPRHPLGQRERPSERDGVTRDGCLEPTGVFRELPPDLRRAPDEA